MTARPSPTPDIATIEHRLSGITRDYVERLDRLAAHARFAQAERAYHARNAAWRNSPEGIAYRDKCRSRDAENAEFERMLAKPTRSPEEVAARIRAACVSWIDVGEENG